MHKGSCTGEPCSGELREQAQGSWGGVLRSRILWGDK